LAVEFYLAILLMLVTAWVLGELVHRLGQPVIVGQLIAGVIIGPSILNLVQPTAQLSTVENVALFFLMLLTGLAVRPARIIAAGRRGLVISTASFIIPFVLGVYVAQAFGVGVVASLTVGLTISITAVPVNSIILMQLGILDTELGTAVIAAGVVDDIISFGALGVIQQFASSGGLTIAHDTDILLALAKIAIFLAGLFVCERLIRTHLPAVREKTEKFAGGIRAPGSYITMLIVFAVGISLLAEWSGIQLVLGAFFAGLLLSEMVGGKRLDKAGAVIRGSTFGFFGPIAFSFIGTQLVLSSMSGMIELLALLLAVAVASKLLGGFLGAKATRFTNNESLLIALLMNSRGFVELVISSTAYQAGLIDQSVFSLVITIGILTTIMSPVASRMAMRRAKIRPVEVDPTIEELA
jgi:Kef-type K+ transport system membrane component KefB